MLTQLLLALQMASCTNCDIQATRLVTIADPDGRAGLSYPTGIARTRSGTWLVTHAGVPSQVAEFSSEGLFVRRVGRNGAGPGEFRTATLVNVGLADSVWVLDATLHRMSVLSPNLQYVRSHLLSVPYVVNMRPMADGRFIIDAMIASDNRAGYPLHVMERDGRISRSFGVDAPPRGRQTSDQARRVFWPAGPNAVWTGDIVQYRLQLWTLDGRKLNEVVRRVGWFPPQERFGSPRNIRSAPPSPGLVAVQPDSAGLLWTIIRVPGSNWRSGIGESPRTGRLGVVDAEKYWDTMVEVINPATGAAIASIRMNEVLYGFVAPGIAFQIHQNAFGEMSYVMWQLALTGRR